MNATKEARPNGATLRRAVGPGNATNMTTASTKDDNTIGGCGQMGGGGAECPPSTANETFNDGLPPIESTIDVWDDLPELAPPLIEGVLRQGHKMLLAGPSKAGKSYALIELAICIAEGLPWLGFQCAQGKVMYVNLELDRASCLHRFHDVRQAMGAQSLQSLHSVDIWNLRGYSIPMNQLAPKMIRKFRNRGYIAVIVDPIYKVLTGNENKAYDMTQFCNCFDQVAIGLSCAVIYCHHHSKGDQSWKRAVDRASGSGVFARDADALLDVTELELPPDQRREGTTAWRITGTLREFKEFPPVDVWYNWPLHVVEHFDSKEVAPHYELPPWKRAMNGRKSKEEKLKERKHRIEAAVDILQADGVTPTIKALADYLGVSADTVRRSVDEHDGLVRENGVVRRA